MNNTYIRIEAGGSQIFFIELDLPKDAVILLTVDNAYNYNTATFYGGISNTLQINPETNVVTK